MFIPLHGITPAREPSLIQRPFCVSIEADVPDGTAVVVIAECADSLGMVHRKTFVNPAKAVLPTPEFKRIGLKAELSRGSLAVPFFYAIVVEGDGWRHVYDAKALYEARESETTSPLHLMLPSVIAQVDSFAPAHVSAGLLKDDETEDDENPETAAIETASADMRPYLTVPLFPGALVSASQTQKPYIVDVDGGGYSDSYLKVVLGGPGSGDGEWEHRIEVFGESKTSLTTREELAVPIQNGFGVSEIQLRASSDGHHSVGLSGVALEGDGRRFYMSAGDLIADLIGDKPLPDNLELLRFSNSPATMLTLKHQTPKFSGFPSAMLRLGDMSQRGELDPNFLQGHPLRFGLMNFASDAPDETQQEEANELTGEQATKGEEAP